ncbi:MAG: hypothetical protein M3440_10405 [Chloroflexota bacterium]|nr:hypothetical protein [Chloroflexota bacterium]
MNMMTTNAGRAMVVALMAVMVMVAPAQAQFEGAGTDDAESVAYLNSRAEQGITVNIEPLGKPSPGLSHGDAMLMVVDAAFLEESMDGYVVLESDELDDEQLKTMGADAGKLFAIIDEESLEPALVLVLVSDDDLIMIGYLGFGEGDDMMGAVMFAQDVVKDGVEADPPAGFVEVD